MVTTSFPATAIFALRLVTLSPRAQMRPLWRFRAVSGDEDRRVWFAAITGRRHTGVLRRHTPKPPREGTHKTAWGRPRRQCTRAALGAWRCGAAYSHARHVAT